MSNVFQNYGDIAAALHVIHSNWIARNGVRFNNASFSVHAATTKLLTSFSLSHQMISGHSNTAEHAALQLLHLVAGTAQPVTVRLVLWKTLAVNGKGRWNWHIVRADGICGLRMIQRPLSLKFMILFLGSYVIGGQIVFRYN
jgi:hypothetical protein